MSTAQAPNVIISKTEELVTYRNINDVIVLNHKEIVKLLPLFKEECVYMCEAYLEDGVLRCSFNTFDYPFSKEPTKHLTRTHALLFVTQASYLTATILQQQNSQWPIDMEAARYLALEEQMTFTNIELNFRHFIKNVDGIELNLSFPEFRIIRDRLFVGVEFDFPKGCYGKCQGVVALDGSMNMRS